MSSEKLLLLGSGVGGFMESVKRRMIPLHKWYCVCFCVYLCVCIRVHVHTHAHLFSCVWRPEVSVERKGERDGREGGRKEESGGKTEEGRRETGNISQTVATSKRLHEQLTLPPKCLGTSPKQIRPKRSASSDLTHLLAGASPRR